MNPEADGELAALLAAGPAGAQLPAALRWIGRRFEAASGTLHGIGRDGQLVMLADFGMPPALRSIVSVIPIGKGIAGQAAQRREPVSICNIQSDPTGVTRPGARSTGVEGALAVPILDGSELLGVLGIGKAQAHTYSPQEIELLQHFGAMLVDQIRVRLLE